MLALSYTSGRVDLLVRALLKQPLRAYTGLVKPAHGRTGGADRGTRWIPTQQVPVRQLYLPGLATGTPQPLFETVFQQPAQITRLA